MKNKVRAADNWEVRFNKEFMLKGSDCTWNTHPDPEAIKLFIKELLQQNTREVIDIMEKKYARKPSAYDLNENDLVGRNGW